MIDKIANELIIASVIERTNQVQVLAEKIGYQPIVILNALARGEKADKLVYVRKKNIIKINKDVEVGLLAITEYLGESRDMIEEFITNQNAREVDISFEELRTFIPMLPELHLKIALYTSKLLGSYEVADPVDKESVYTFYSLKENVSKRWGEKQFDKKQSIVSKRGRASKRSK